MRRWTAAVIITFALLGTLFFNLLTSWRTHVYWRPSILSEMGKEPYVLTHVLVENITQLRFCGAGGQASWCSHPMEFPLYDTPAWPSLLLNVLLNWPWQLAQVHQIHCATVIRGRTLLLHRDLFNYFHALTRDAYWAFRALLILREWKDAAVSIPSPLREADLPDNILLVDNEGGPLNSTPLTFIKTLLKPNGSLLLAIELQSPVCFDTLVCRTLQAGFATPVQVTEPSCQPNELLLSLRDHMLRELRLHALQLNMSCPLLFVGRQNSTRKIVNFDDLLAFLDVLHIQYLVVDFGQLRIEEQIALAVTACGMIGMHGAGLTNSLFMPSGAPLIELMPHITTHELENKVHEEMLSVYINFACETRRPFYRHIAPEPLSTDNPVAARKRGARVNVTVVGTLVVKALEAYNYYTKSV